LFPFSCRFLWRDFGGATALAGVAPRETLAGLISSQPCSLEKTAYNGGKPKNFRWAAHSNGIGRRNGSRVNPREVEELLAERGITVTYETVRQWCQKFGPAYARKFKNRQGRLGDIWHIDEVFVTIQGERHYLWRAVDQDGDVIDILVQPRRNQRAAERFFRRLIKGQGGEPRWLVTDKLRSYDPAHRTIMPTVHHLNHIYANNRDEVSHESTRQQERTMRGFRSSEQAQRFLTLHGLIHNLFRLGRHLLRAVNYRFLRTQAFQVWQDVVCV
jgi:putative transposase